MCGKALLSCKNCRITLSPRLFPAFRKFLAEQEFQVVERGAVLKNCILHTQFCLRELVFRLGDCNLRAQSVL